MTDLFDDYGFPAYSAASHLCGKRDLGQSEPITWDAFVSADAPERVVAAYKRRLGERGFTAAGAGGSWTFPERSLTVLSPDQTGKHKSCDAKPSPAAKSVLVLTRR